MRVDRDTGPVIAGPSGEPGAADELTASWFAALLGGLAPMPEVDAPAPAAAPAPDAAPIMLVAPPTAGEGSSPGAVPITTAAFGAEVGSPVPTPSRSEPDRLAGAAPGRGQGEAAARSRDGRALGLPPGPGEPVTALRPEGPRAAGVAERAVDPESEAGAELPVDHGPRVERVDELPIASVPEPGGAAGPGMHDLAASIGAPVGGPTRPAAVAAPADVPVPAARPIGLGELPGRVAVDARALRAAGDGDHEAVLQLDPPELGRVHLRVHVVAGRVEVEIHAERPESREVLRRAADELRAELGRDGGATAVQVDVRDRPAPHPRPPTPRAPHSDARSDPSAAPAAGPIRSRTPASQPARAADGRVDVHL
jgi:flagellar hook-length control protein FliK